MEKELLTFTDYIAPGLDVYEQAIFLHLFRRSHLDGTDEITIGLRTARKEIGFGAGDSSKPMSEATITKKVNSLEKKSLVEKIDSTRQGTVLRVVLPTLSIYYVEHTEEVTEQSIDQVDFSSDPVAKKAIIRREGNKCVYCFVALNDDNHVMEHIISIPKGDNSYKNIAASCRTCNNKKSDKAADEFLRILYRSNILSQDELEERLTRIEEIQAGKHVPVLEP